MQEHSYERNTQIIPLDDGAKWRTSLEVQVRYIFKK